MAERSDTAPNIRREYAPLDALIVRALRRMGDFSPGSVDAQLILLMVDFANQIIDEVRAHPYWTGEEVSYYEHPTDWRAIPDGIIVSGLAYHYAAQQGSQKAAGFGPQYIRDLNRGLWQRLNGNTPIQLKVVDGGSNPRNSQDLTTSETNGTVS